MTNNHGEILIYRRRCFKFILTRTRSLKNKNCTFVFQNLLFEVISYRSVSFFGHITQERVKNIKKTVWRSETTICLIKMFFEKGCVYPKIFPLFKGPGRAHTGPYGPIWSDFWSNFARFGSKTYFLTKFRNDSAWFLPEKLKKHIFFN